MLGLKTLGFVFKSQRDREHHCRLAVVDASQQFRGCPAWAAHGGNDYVRIEQEPHRGLWYHIVGDIMMCG